MLSYDTIGKMMGAVIVLNEEVSHYIQENPGKTESEIGEAMLINKKFMNLVNAVGGTKPEYIKETITKILKDESEKGKYREEDGCFYYSE